MGWKLEYSPSAQKSLRKLDPAVRNRILQWLDENVDNCQDPRARGKALAGGLSGLWRYRVGDYRIICSIEGSVMVVLVIDVEHRSKVYSTARRTR